METFSALLALCEGNPPVPAWANNRDAGDLRRHGAHYDVTIVKIRRPTSRPSCLMALNIKKSILSTLQFTLVKLTVSRPSLFNDGCGLDIEIDTVLILQYNSSSVIWFGKWLLHFAKVLCLWFHLMGRGISTNIWVSIRGHCCITTCPSPTKFKKHQILW